MDIYFILSAFFVLSIGLFVICGIYLVIIAIYHKTLRYETFPSTAEVCMKEYEYEDTTYLFVGGMLIPETSDEEFNVYLMYDGKQYCFDDKDLYNSVNVGDIVSVLVHKGYNKRNQLKYVYLSFEN